MKSKLHNRMVVKNNIRILRRNLRLTQAEIAKRCGLTEKNYRLIETGEAKPAFLTAWLICKALKGRDGSENERCMAIVV
jgi:DNA-binding XRE family transcriptional regulator